MSERTGVADQQPADRQVADRRSAGKAADQLLGQTADRSVDPSADRQSADQLADRSADKAVDQSAAGRPVEQSAGRRAAQLTDQSVVERALAAAERLFDARGVQAVGMDAIRDESGVPLKRLYREFPSKADLLHAVLERRDASVRAAIAAFVDSRAGGAPARERILAVFDYLAAWFVEPDFRGCMFLNTAGELGGTSEPVLDVGRRHKQALRAYFADLVAAAGLPPDLADQLMVLANGAMCTAALNGTPDAAAHARAAAATLIGASAEAAPPG